MSDSSLRYGEVGLPETAMLSLVKEVGVFCRWGEEALRRPESAGGNLWDVITAPRRLGGRSGPTSG